MISDWRKEIAIAWYVQNETAKLDKKRLWNYLLPKVAATEQDLAATEGVLGFALDPRYRAFLSYANGWRCFYQDVDIFGTAELRGGYPMRDACSILDEIDSEVFAKSKLVRSDLFPIGFSGKQSDVFVLLKPGRANSGAIVWLAGYEIERFPQFDEFFLAMVDYNRIRFEGFRTGESL